MNLHGIVRGAVGAVNPEIQATLRKNMGNTTLPSGKQVAGYLSSTGLIQVQGVVGDDLTHVNNLNIQGVTRKVYLPGNWTGVVRADQKGGDLLYFSQFPGSVVQEWMIKTVFEAWPDWSSVLVVLQTSITTGGYLPQPPDGDATLGNPVYIQDDFPGNLDFAYQWIQTNVGGVPGVTTSWIYTV